MSSPKEKAEFVTLLEYLKQNRGFDFTGYKHASLMRRIQARMQRIGVDGFGTYIDYLEVHPDEFAELFNTILINVTTFFRDAPAWDYFRSNLIPRILDDKPADQPIRVWSAGCASGEEAYSAAIMFAEALGLQKISSRLKIFGTDVDEEALNQARHAAYPPAKLEDVPPALREKYFDSNGSRSTVHQELRRTVIFGRHDLIQDAPISRLDLLICRNVLMYFNAETQTRILDRFGFALRDGSFLFLGKAEMLLTRGNIFVPVDLKRRFFTKRGRGGMRDRLPSMAPGADKSLSNQLLNQTRFREMAFDMAPVPQLVVDANGFLAVANFQARSQFGLDSSDLGRPFQDLEVSYKPAELRSLIEQASTERRPLTLQDVEWRNKSGSSIYLTIEVSPLLDNNSLVLGVNITFSDGTSQRRLREELERATAEIESAYLRLQHTNEELETTNEELQSTNEELETANEELQSTKEELETMNEEL